MFTRKLLAKRSIKSAASLAKAGFNYRQSDRNSVNIFAYHRVVADIKKAEQEAIYGIVISTNTFRRHCEILKSSFDVVSLETASEFINNGQDHERPLAAITFDDGYQDFFDEAFPVLADLGLPATMFLPTEFIGEKKPLAHDRIFWLLKLAIENATPIREILIKAGVNEVLAEKFRNPRKILQMTDSLVYLPNDLRERIIEGLESAIGSSFQGYPDGYQLLDWNRVREMAGLGINFGSHTANHVVLPVEKTTVAQTEIEQSKEKLESEIGKKVISFAYPNGKHNAAVRNLTIQAGYEVAVTTQNRVNRKGVDLFSLGRKSLCEESTRGVLGTYSPGIANLRLGV